MIYQGKALTAQKIDEGFLELKFDLEGESINKLSSSVLQELGVAVQEIAKLSDVKGLIMTSGKDVFIVGADITEFPSAFGKTEDELVEMNMLVHKLFNTIEDLPFPTVAAINGLALGGGFEVTLPLDFRVASTKSKMGFPETQLGILPGWGGCVRFPRISGADNAIEWIAGGKQGKPDEALKIGIIDAVVEPEKLREAALDILREANAGNLDYASRRAEKKAPLRLNPIESMMVFETAKGFVAGKAGPNYPSPIESIKVIQKGATAQREKAQEIEAKAFAKMAKTSVAFNLVGLFLNDQAVKKVAKNLSKDTKEVKQAAVLGAGIMGGGIAYQSAYKGTPIVMKDINEPAIQLGLNEAKKLLAKRVERKRMTPEAMADALNGIRPTLSYGDFKEVDLVVEAVVENPKIKGAVLAEVEGNVSEDTIITSNTSTISITSLAQNLKRPENFCGMHFFNPVHRMPLVEVIRGEKSSEKTIGATVAYATKMGKTPIVVNDCPGFLVNRILFPYFGGFSGLVARGADFVKVDKVMEKFGMPMGPAYLLDVVGMDTAVHAGNVMAEGFPDRMKHDLKAASEVLFENNRLGQKNGKGFYKYELDKKGKQKKVVDTETYDLIKSVVTEQNEFSDEDIINATIVPLVLESVRCLEDGIVASPAELDMALIYGIGFPPFRGGAIRYLEAVGIAEFVKIADSLTHLSPLYAPTDKLREMAAKGEKFYS